jgi:prepilin-type N-terminal cleavage/methylation domain-containing protein
VESNHWTKRSLIIESAFHLRPITGSTKESNMKINYSRKAGFTLVEIMIVVAIIALLAAIAIPNFVKARTLSQKSACIANLKQIDGAKATWAMELKKSSTATMGPSDLYGATLYIRDEPSCPGGGTYTLNPVDTKPTCTLTTEGHSL